MKLFLVALKDEWVLAQELERQGDQVAEVDKPVLGQLLLVDLVSLTKLNLLRQFLLEKEFILCITWFFGQSGGEAFSVDEILLWGDVLILGPTKKSEDRTQVLNRISQRPEAIER